MSVIIAAFSHSKAMVPARQRGSKGFAVILPAAQLPVTPGLTMLPPFEVCQIPLCRPAPSTGPSIGPSPAQAPAQHRPQPSTGPSPAQAPAQAPAQGHPLSYSHLQMECVLVADACKWVLTSTSKCGWFEPTCTIRLCSCGGGGR